MTLDLNAVIGFGENRLLLTYKHHLADNFGSALRRKLLLLP